MFYACGSSVGRDEQTMTLLVLSCVANAKRRREERLKTEQKARREFRNKLDNSRVARRALRSYCEGMGEEGHIIDAQRDAFV